METDEINTWRACLQWVGARADVTWTNAWELTESTNTNSQLAIRSAIGADEQRVAREVRHELVMLPYYSIFDDLEYSVNGGTILGSVVNPTLKSDAEHAVKHIEGVTQVNNQIKVLPPSPNDDQIRRQVARSIYSQDGLFKY